MGIQELKAAVVSATGLSKDALHVYFGLIVFVAVAAAFRRPFRSIIPWLAVIGVAIVGELVDVRDDLASLGHWRWSASLHDFVNTIFWPTVLLFLAQRRVGSG
jgi:uncharacterized membrane protein YqgA involved in biofilm formation